MPKTRGSDFREVRHRGWRDFDHLRRAATNAVAGLGFGVELAMSEARERHDRGDELTFSRAFPALDAATDFDFRPSDAAEELLNAEATLAQMTIPFAVTIYNEYVVEAVRLHERFSPSGLARSPESMTLGDLWSHLATAHGVVMSGHQAELLALLAHLRNRIVHYGGRAGAHLVQLRSGLSPAAEDAWERVARYPFPRPVVGERLPLRRRDAAAALAAVDHAASELNSAMRSAFPSQFWAEIAVEDHAEASPEAWRFRDQQRRARAIRGFVDRDYRDLGITDDEIAEAVARAS